jgi:hypothetical protein
MIIYRLTVSKKQLNLFPEKERIFFIQMGHLANELTTLTKILICANAETEIQIMKRAYTTQTSIIARICIGKVYEGWRLFQDYFFSSQLAKKYEAKLSQSGQENLQKLKKYFGKKNLICEIRNKFSFHNPSSQDIKNQLELIPDEADLDLYIGTQHANSNYYLSEEIISRAMLNYVESTSLQQAMDTMYKEFIEVSGWFVEFCGHCMVAMCDEYWRQDPRQLRIEHIHVKSEGNVKDFKIPFYVEK